MKIINLRAELFENPVGLGEIEPELSWELVGPAPSHGRQTAYRILVANTPEGLLAEEGDLWDSGRVVSATTAFVRYAGRPLTSRQRCYWRVVIWDESGVECASDVASWTMGLLKKDDWQARWIGLDSATEYPLHPLPGARWIWAGPAVPGELIFEKTFELPSAVEGFLWGLADDEAEVEINGQPICSLARAQGGYNLFPLPLPIAVGNLRAGENTIIVRAKKRHDRDPHAGVIMRLSAGGREVVENVRDFGLDFVQRSWVGGTEIVSDASWRCLRDAQSLEVREMGSFGVEPWHLQGVAEYPSLRARYLRKEFEVSAPVARAVVYFSGLGLSEAWINGHRVGDEVLSPHATDYSKIVCYRTFDVTDLMQSGANAVGCILGNGRFFAPRARIPFHMEHYGTPRLLLQLEVEYADGRVDYVVSDSSWSISTQGAIGWNNEFDGEDYDARRDSSDWCRPGFASESWSPAQLVAMPMGKLSAQISDPIRVTERRSPAAQWTTKYGTRIFDFGINLVGWCRGTFEGPEGSAVSLHFAEAMESPDHLATENLRSAHCLDRITLRQGVTEFEPKFTYHGFRYVEMRGGACQRAELEACFVHDDVRSSGSFDCSNPLVNRIVEAAARGIRGNYRSMPTDCPQRDERMGWLGDRAGGAPGEMFLFDISKLYRKWMGDIRAAQGDNGCVPDIAPPFWRMYSDNVTWPSCMVFVPFWLHRHYGDVTVIRQNFDAMTRWLAHLCEYLEGGLLARDLYGDWCVPPESRHLIHSERADLKTSPVILASTYLAKNLELAATMAGEIGREDLAQKWLALRGEIAAALNQRLFDREKGCYDNGSQTASLLPLAFGLVPEENQRQVFDFLVSRIMESGRASLGTGLVGGQWLLRTLTAFGRPDIACALVAREDYPSWGYMINQGATTIWELWNGDTANPLMNSGNHVMLLGDLITWLFEDVLGIHPASPGFASVLLRPHFVFQSAGGTHYSMRGPIASRWSIPDDQVRWEIEIPPNVEAEVELPASVCDSFQASCPVPDLVASTVPGSPVAWVKTRVGPGRHCMNFARPAEFPAPQS